MSEQLKQAQITQSDCIDIEVVGHHGGICKTGIPFPEGQVTALEQLALRQDKVQVESFARPLAHWPDGSIKWLNIGFFHVAQASARYELCVSDPSELAPSSGIEFQENDQQLLISSNEIQIEIDLNTASLKLISKRDQRPLVGIRSLAGELSCPTDKKLTGKITDWKARPSKTLASDSTGAIELELSGHFPEQADRQPVQFATVIECYQAIPSLKIQSTLHNPNPAKHPNGLWDLGDEGSVLFDAFVFDLDLVDAGEISYQTAPGTDWQTADGPTRIIQHASGGTHWQSPVHVDRDNKIPLIRNGFEVISGRSPVAQGNRATPSLFSNTGVSLTCERFWQNFPSAVEVNQGQVSLGLFPSTPSHPHELQGGEKKTHTFWLDFSGQRTSLDWVHTPPRARAENTWLEACVALPTYLASTEKDKTTQLIETGLSHEKNFFAKREIIDEYGWRNFGDLYADHETAGYSGEEPFVSHYNNQYDPIYGFLRQFLLTGDSRWFELADDLARHVKDIDIYHTQGDKAAYNGGLFWHTDHYLKAFTATHRTFSKFQGYDAYEGRTGGGGPGGQHCYTTGLTYHYLLTGAEDSKQAVLTLKDWITNVYEGTNTCVELLLALKNRHLPGLKNHLNGRYPFDRGTGNYVIALLDCYQLTLEQEYLHRVEQIIRNTIHPADNINEHHLTDVENHWFYIVLLQAVCRYLEIKERTNSFDNGFYYARDALLHYADWILANEYPYLEKPEILEFPNETWTAQDLRKSHILAAAFYYSPTSGQEYLEKAIYFQEYVASRISKSEELSYSRIQVLLMQNHGPLEYYSSKSKTKAFAERKHNWPSANYQQPNNISSNFLKALGKRLINLSISNEVRWLKQRLRN